MWGFLVFCKWYYNVLDEFQKYILVQLRIFHYTDFVVDYSSSKSVVGGPPLVANEVVQDLKQNIYKLEEEVSLKFLR